MSKIISDIDGTIVNFGRPIKAVCNWLNEKADAGYDIVYLTNRPESDRKKTVAELKKLKVPSPNSASLIMNDTGKDAPEFKSEVISRMIDDGEDIYAFIDDRPDTRYAVRKLGDILVLDPAIKSKKEKTSEVHLCSFSKTEMISMSYNEFFRRYGNKWAAKQEKIKVPKFIQSNAKRGIELNSQGFGGDGLVPKTIREARDMANGTITLDKCMRMSAWFARHKVDTTTEGFKNKKSPKYPSAGLVAWLLWGGDADGSFRAKDWADSQLNKTR